MGALIYIDSLTSTGTSIKTDLLWSGGPAMAGQYGRYEGSGILDVSGDEYHEADILRFRFVAGQFGENNNANSGSWSATD